MRRERHLKEMQKKKKLRLTLGVAVLIPILFLNGCASLPKGQGRGSLRAPEYSQQFILQVESIRAKIIKSSDFSEDEKITHDSLVADWIVWVEASQEFEGL